MKRKLKKTSIVLISVFILITLLAGCGKEANNSSNTDSTSGTSKESQETTVQPSKVVVWYLWGGGEGQIIADCIDRFNKSQDKYIVEGLSVPDEQKIKVAISSGNGPDTTDSFSRNVAVYADSGISISLNDLIKRDNYDMSDFNQAAVDTCTYNGEVHALPLNITNPVLYYNKTLLAEAGYTEPPKTSKELLEMAIATTKLNENGTIKVMGFPCWPFEPYWLLSGAFGAPYLNSDSEPMFESEGSLEALRMVYTYTEKFGADNIKEFNATCKWLDGADPFLRGEMAFRMEGSPLTAFIDKNDWDIDYGVAPIPYLEGHPETEGSTEINSSTFYITKTAKNVDGAWEFLKFMYSTEELATVMSQMSNIPAKMSTWTHPLFKDQTNLQKIMSYAQHKNAFTLPCIPELGDIINKVVAEEVEGLSNLRITPEEAAANMQSRTLEILK